MKTAKITWHTVTAPADDYTSGDYDWHLVTGKRTIAGVKREDDANLIVAAVNACQEVNANNPLAVAESIEEMYAALKLLQSALTEYRLRDVKKRYSLCLADAAASKAIAKAEGR